MTTLPARSCPARCRRGRHLRDCDGRGLQWMIGHIQPDQLFSQNSNVSWVSPDMGKESASLKLAGIEESLISNMLVCWVFGAFRSSSPATIVDLEQLFRRPKLSNAPALMRLSRTRRFSCAVTRSQKCPGSRKDQPIACLQNGFDGAFNDVFDAPRPKRMDRLCDRFWWSRDRFTWRPASCGSMVKSSPCS